MVAIAMVPFIGSAGQLYAEDLGGKFLILGSMHTCATFREARKPFSRSTELENRHSAYIAGIITGLNQSLEGTYNTMPFDRETIMRFIENECKPDLTLGLAQATIAAIKKQKENWQRFEHAR